MQSSHPHHDRSPPEHEFSSNSPQHHPYNNRGFRGRRPYRNRGGFYHNNFRHASWKPHVSVKEEPVGDTSSLLSRLESTSDSLLSRLSPTKDTGSPKTPKRRGSLVERISRTGGDVFNGGDPMAVDDNESIASSKNDSPKRQLTIDVNAVLAEQLIADALEQGKQLVEQHSADDHESQKSAESEAAVDDLLAADDEPPSSSPPIPARSLEEPASSGATVMPIEPVASSRSTSMDRTTLLEQAKLLLVPIIAQNARRRDPDADPKALEERVMSLVTDEQCLEFLRLARESQTQMKGGTTAASDGTGETEVGEVKLEGHMAPRGSEAAGMADGVEATDVASAQAVQSPGTKRQRTPMAELAESSRPRKTPRPTSGSDDSTSGHQDARVSHDRTKDSGLASTSRPSPAVAEHELGKEPPTAPRALSDAPRDLPSRPGIQMKVADAPVIISPRNKSTQGKSSLPTDRRSTGSAVTGSRTGDERHAASVANLDAPRLNELKRTASCAESEDMDVDPNADPSPGRQSPVLDQSQDSTITLASVSAEPTDAPPSSVTAVSQDGTPHTPVEVKDLAGTVTSLPSPDHSRGAQQDQPSPVETQTSSRATLSNAAAALARPPISHAESSTNRQASNVHYSQTHTSTLDANLSDKSSSLLSVSTGSLLSDNGEASAELLSRQPNTERAIPSSESHIPGKSGPHDNLGLTNVASDPDRGDRSAARAQDTSSGRNNNEDLPSANKSQQQEILSDAEASPSVEARQSLPLSANPNPGSSVVTNGSTPVANTDIVSSTAATFAPAVSPPSPLAQPASSTRDSRRIDDDISAPPDAVLADDHRSISSAITQRPDHNTVPMEVDPAVPTSSSTASKPPPTEPEPPAPLRIPGLYFAEVGKNHAAVYNVTFHVDDESAAAAKRWSSRATTTDPSASYTFRLLCLHVSEVQGAVENGQSASPEEFATALWQMKTRWPPRGQLIVEMNNESDARGSWLPRQLGPDDGPIDVTPHIIPGTNAVRIVQLSGLADRIFVLYVGQPNSEQKKDPAPDSWESWSASVKARS